MLPKSMYLSKASDALASTFKQCSNVSLPKIRAKALNLCKRLNLITLSSAISANKALSLDVFFSAQTHQPECPLRVIVSENRAWQKLLSLYLKQPLEKLLINDPCKVRNSQDVVCFLARDEILQMNAFPIDIKDL